MDSRRCEDEEPWDADTINVTDIDDDCRDMLTENEAEDEETDDGATCRPRSHAPRATVREGALSMPSIVDDDGDTSMAANGCAAAAPLTGACDNGDDCGNGNGDDCGNGNGALASFKLIPRHILIVVHCNYRPQIGGASRTAARGNVPARDIVGLFVGDVVANSGMLFRIAPDDFSSARSRRAASRAVFIDKFYNRRNFARTVEVPNCRENSTVALSNGERDVRLQMCESFNEAARRLCRYLRANSIGSLYHKLSPPVMWITNTVNNLDPELDVRFVRLPRDINAREVMISPLCLSRANHNTVACEICLFDDYAGQMRARTVHSSYEACSSIHREVSSTYL